MKRYITELLGTLILVLTVLLSIYYSSGIWIGLIIASVLTIIIYIGAPYSKAHYNPAVSLGFFIRGFISTKQLLGYWISEFLGSALAIFTFCSLTKEKITLVGSPFQPHFPENAWLLFGAEFFGTFCLVSVILAVATLKATEGNKYYGIAISSCVFLMILLVGNRSGAVINPAVEVAFIATELQNSSYLLLYLIAQFVAGIASSYCFNFFSPSGN